MRPVSIFAEKSHILPGNFNLQHIAPKTHLGRHKIIETEVILMANHMQDYMNSRSELLAKTIVELDKKIKRLPEGSIYVDQRGNKAYFHRYDAKSGEKYISKTDTDTIAVYIQKDYLKKVMHAAITEHDALLKMQKLYPEVLAEDIYDQLPKSRKRFITPIVSGDEEYARKWLEKSYRRKGFSKDAPVFITLKGDRVRSKSEMIIADRLWANGIPYKYECPVQIGDIVIHPDFTILRMSDRRILYHEHCGMVDNVDYYDNMVSRINDYGRAGISFGDRLFLTFESSKTPLDSSVVDKLIKLNYK